MKRLLPITALVICSFAAGAFSAQVMTQIDGDTCRLAWQGDERVEVAFSRARGLLESPIHVRVDNRELSFDGFYVAFNGERGGYVGKSVNAGKAHDSFRV